MMQRITAYIFFSVISLFHVKVFAACNASATTTPATVNYGTHASQTLPAGGISPNGTSLSGYFSVTCSSALTLQLLSTASWLRYTAQNSLTLSNGTDSINYVLASNTGYSPSISSSGQSIGGPTGFNVLSLGLLTSGRVDVPLFVKTVAITKWPNAGTYTGTQTLTVDGSICTSISVLNACLTPNAVNSTVTMNMTMVVSKSCEFVSVPALVDVGSVSFLENAIAAQLSVSVRCTNQEDYLLYADNGNNYASGSRRLKSAGGQHINYAIFHPASTSQVIGSTNALNRTGTGMSETINLPVRVTSGQPTPAAGIYSDSVRMVIEY